MQLFDLKGVDSDYERWLDPPDVHEEDGCDRCHEIHKDEGIFRAGCRDCQEGKCLSCNGTGWIKDDEGELEHAVCKGQGRLW